MAYTIVKSDGVVLTSIPDGTINTTSTSLGLPGRNYAGYGQSLDTNFVHILENFADSTPPPNPLRGQLWFNTNNSTLYVCPSDGQSNGLAWLSLTSTASGGTTTFGSITVSGNVLANNLSVTNGITSSSINTSTLSVATIANIALANITTANIGTLHTAVITTGSTSTPGTLTGAWTVNGSATLGGFAGAALLATGGNLVVSSAAGRGIVADNFYYSNGSPISFAGTSYSAGNGLSLAGTVFSVNAAQPNITSVGTLTGLGVNGNITATNITANTGVITGNGSGISALNASNISTGTLAQARLANSNVVLGSTTLTLGTTTTSITGLTSLGVSGTATAGTLVSNIATGTAPLTVTSTTRVANLNVAHANVSDFISVAAGSGNNFLIFANAATGNVSELTSTGITANLSNNSITATTFVGNLVGNISGNFVVPGANTELIFNNQGNAGASSALTFNSATNILSVNGNVTAANITASTGVFTGNGSAITNLNASNISSGTLSNTRLSGSYSISVNTATTAATVTTNAQPNITSVGTLGSLTVSGNISAQGSVQSGVIALVSSTVNCALGNYFTRTISGSSSWSVTNIPVTGAFSFIIQLTNGGTGVQTWFTNTRWPGGIAPTLTVSGVDLLGFVTDDGGANWRGVLLMKDSK